MYQSRNCFITDALARFRIHQRDHHFADVLRRAELSVLTCRLQLAEHIFVEIALHIAFGEVDVVCIEIVQSRDDLLQNLRRGNQEHRAVHVTGKCAFIFTGQILDKREYLLSDDIENLAAVAVFEFAPAHRLTFVIKRKDVRQCFAGEVFHLLDFGLFFIERADEHEVCELFDDGQRVCDAARPDICPDLVDLVFDLACYHVSLLFGVVYTDTYIIAYFEEYCKYFVQNEDVRRDAEQPRVCGAVP